MKILLIVLLAALLSSCSATYDSLHTGIKYKFEVPFSAVEHHIARDK